MDTIDLIILLILLLIIPITLLVLRLSLRKQDQLLTQQAQQRNGTFIPGGWFRLSRLEFHHNGLLVTVFYSPGSRYSPPYTWVRAELPQAFPVRLVLYRKRLGAPFFRSISRSLQTVESGDLEFDQKFGIQTDREVLARRLFSSSTLTQRLMALERKGPEMNLSNRKFELKVAVQLKDMDNYDALIDTAVLTLDLLERASFASVGTTIEI